MTKTNVILPDLDDDLGPAMRALTPLMRKFVVARVFYGLDNSNACRAAGYSETFAGHQAYTLAHREDVQLALEEQCRRLMKSEGPKSILTLVEIRDDKTQRGADRIKAASELLNRAGLHAITEHHEHQHTHVSEAEMDRRILALAAELGMAPADAQKMLIAPQDMQQNADGVFEITVEPKPLSDDPRAVGQRKTRARRKGMSPEEIKADKRRIQAERAETLRRERAAAETHRAGVERLTRDVSPGETVEAEDPWADVEY